MIIIILAMEREPFPEKYIFDESDLPADSGWSMRRVLAEIESGRIRLGSTVVLELPGRWDLLGRDGQKVVAGETPLACLS